MDDDVFVGLVTLAKLGDEAARTELLRHFEEDVRMMVRARLPRALRAQFDSMDFAQAVWKSFFADGSDPCRFTNSRHMRAFLAGVAKNKVFEAHRRSTKTRKYELGREEPLYVRREGREEPREVAGRDPSPSQTAQARECLERMLAGRPPVEARVVELRGQGLTFVEIAERTGLGERSVRRVIDGLRERLEARP